MKLNDQILKCTLENPGNPDDELIYISEDKDFLEKNKNEIRRINKLIFNFKIENEQSNEELLSLLKSKIDGKHIASYVGVSKYLNANSITLSNINKISDSLILETIQEYQNKLKSINKLHILINDEVSDLMSYTFAWGKSTQRQAGIGQQKVRKQLKEYNFKEIFKKNEFKKMTFSINESLIAKIIEMMKVPFDWHVDKKADFIFMDKAERVYIGEHKNTKEGGGAQSNQTFQVIDLLKIKMPENIMLVGYIEGGYLEMIKSPKEFKQLEELKNAINNGENFFVNKHSFDSLLKNITQ